PLGVGLAVCAIVGDLVESLFKRAANVKDTGGVIPGMGGLLDVLDSILFTAPALYLVLRLLQA
ncbi:MAG TPA: phosphatidate cytidylyltransferase, partial [Kiritimatiellia bacterium]|nr:phosphatidate cytidylyltransferase [Kiritimatiellia bacterium]HOE00907.1 phosphatidate cytidylyltransferase [Kiritimatiellia bacterium]